jgi:hypothetical protein
MKPNVKAFWLIWIFSFVMLAGWAYVVFGDARALRSEAARLQADMQRLALEQKALSERRQADQAEMRSLENSDDERWSGRPAHERWARDILRVIDEFRANPPVKSAGKAMRPPPPTSRVDDVCFPEMLKDAEYMRLSTVYYRYALEEQYAPLLNRLGLSAMGRGSLIGLLLDKKFTEMDARDLLGGADIHRGDAGMPNQPKIDAVAASETDREIRAFLGEEAFGMYLDFERTRWVRRPVEGLAERLTIVGLPLSPDQQDKLVELVFAETPPNEVTGRVTALDISKSAVEKAQTILTSPQWRELQQIEKQNEASERFFRGTIERAVNRNEAKKLPRKLKSQRLLPDLAEKNHAADGDQSAEERARSGALAFEPVAEGDDHEGRAGDDGEDDAARGGGERPLVAAHAEDRAAEGVEGNPGVGAPGAGGSFGARASTLVCERRGDFASGEEVLDKKPRGGEDEAGEDALVGGGDAERDATGRFAGERGGEVGFAAHHGAETLSRG